MALYQYGEPSLDRAERHSHRPLVLAKTLILDVAPSPLKNVYCHAYAMHEIVANVALILDAFENAGVDRVRSERRVFSIL